MNIHEERVKELQGILRKNLIDGIVVARSLEVGLLTGYFTAGVLLLITQDEVFGIMPKMLFDDFKAKVPFVKAQYSDKPKVDLVNKKEKLGLRRAVFEPGTEDYIRGKYWLEHGFTEFSELTSLLRLCKKGEEVDILRQSCRIAAIAFDKLLPTIKTGETEMEIANRLDMLMRSMGAKGPSFDLIVAFGENSALPHHVTSQRKLKDNEPVLIDFGCVYHNYCSDITRTFFHGSPNSEYTKVYNIVQKAHDEGIKALRPNLGCIAADKVCRDIIASAGYGDRFIHSTGHGVGLEIHEAPALSINAEEKDKLASGMVVTIEPGIYLNSKFGVRIEDTLLITENGSEILTISK